MYHGSFATFNSCTFTKNHATGDGGVVLINDGPTVTFNNCILTENTAGHAGGAVGAHCYHGTCFAILNSCTLTKNAADNQGGVVYLQGPHASAIFNSCTLDGNTAGSSGGVSYHVNAASPLTFRDSTITNNTVHGELYAFYTQSGTTLNIINPHPLSQTDEVRGSNFVTCTPTPPCEIGDVCTSATPSLGVFCLPNFPFINTISCGDPSNVDRPVKGCSTTTGTLTITLTGLALKNPTSVTVGAGACSVSSSNNTSIICAVTTVSVWGSADTDGGHFINVTKDGKSSTSQITSNQAKLFFSRPRINNMNGDMTAKGGQTFQVTGEFFGPISSNILVTIGGFLCTSIVGKSDTLLELVTPPMTGSRDSKNMMVEVTTGGQSNDVPFTFTYTAPNITSIDLLAQKIAKGAAGVRMIVHGTDFADVTPIADRITIKGILGGTEVDCVNVTRVSSEELRCIYPQSGDGITAYDVHLVVAGQPANKVPLVYCSDVRLVTKFDNAIVPAIAVESGRTVEFTAELSTLLATKGEVIIQAAIAKGEEHCTLSRSAGGVKRSYTDYNTPFIIAVTTTEAEETSMRSCVVELTLESEDPCYNESAKTFKQELAITVTPKICS